MLFWLAVILLSFNFFGYVILLRLALKFSSDKHKEKKFLEQEIAELTILIPIFNEATILKEKIENLVSLSSVPSMKKKIIFIDGGSTDESLSILESAQKENEDIYLMHSPTQGKIQQLNFALSQVSNNSIVVISDADAIIKDKSALKKVTSLLKDPQHGLVGGWAIPDPTTALTVESAFWDKQNRLRYLESISCSSSIVTALFYAFIYKKGFCYPNDCIADDVWASFYFHTKNLSVVFDHEIEVWETRQPQTLWQLFWHKMRKSHAYSTELLRFIEKIHCFDKSRKFLYLFKIFQFLLLPWASLLLAWQTIEFWFMHKYWTLLFSYALLLFGILLASALLTPPPGRERGGLKLKPALDTIFIFAFVNFILIINSLTYFFWRQSSRYARTGQ